MHPKYRHLFFDLDHTLWDFETNSRETLFLLFDKHQLEEKVTLDKKQFFKRYTEVNESKWVLYRQGRITKDQLRAQRFHETFAGLGLRDSGFSKAFEEEYLSLCPRQKALMPGTMELLNYLRDHYELHIITNGFAETQQVKLSESGITDYFKYVFSSEIVGVNKPGAAIFIESLQEVGAHRQESLMIGDNLAADVKGAQNCGIDQVYFNPTRHKHTEKPTFEVAELLEMRAFL